MSTILHCNEKRAGRAIHCMFCFLLWQYCSRLKEKKCQSIPSTLKTSSLLVEQVLYKKINVTTCHFLGEKCVFRIDRGSFPFLLWEYAYFVYLKILSTFHNSMYTFQVDSLCHGVEWERWEFKYLVIKYKCVHVTTVCVTEGYNPDLFFTTNCFRSISWVDILVAIF